MRKFYKTLIYISLPAINSHMLLYHIYLQHISAAADFGINNMAPNPLLRREGFEGMKKRDILSPPPRL